MPRVSAADSRFSSLAPAVPLPPPPPAFDVIIRGGTVYDGTGSPGRRADVGIKGDRIAARRRSLRRDRQRRRPTPPAWPSRPASSTCCRGRPSRCSPTAARRATSGRASRLEIFGEGSSMGPLNDAMKKRMVERDGRHQVRHHLDDARRVPAASSSGAASRPNVASFIGATTIREHVIGLEDKKPTPQQLDEMRALVRQEMEAGALGIGSLADLRAGVLRLDRGADRAVQGRGAVSGQVHLAHAQRGQPPARSGRRADSHQPRGEHSGGDLSPQGRRPGELAEDGRRDRDGREGARARG